MSFILKSEPRRANSAGHRKSRFLKNFDGSRSGLRRLGVHRRSEHLPPGFRRRIDDLPLGMRAPRVADVVDVIDDALPEIGQLLDRCLRSVVARHEQRFDGDRLHTVLAEIAVGERGLVVDRIELLGQGVGKLQDLVVASELLDPAERLSADREDRVDAVRLERLECSGLVAELDGLKADHADDVDHLHCD